DRAKRLVVVHAERAEEADRAERLVGEPVRGADERKLAEAGRLELVSDANERTPRVERLGEDVEERGALLERVDQAPVGADLLGARRIERARGPADVELAVFLDGVERTADRVEKDALAGREVGLVEDAAEDPRAEPDPAEPLAEIVRGPEDEARVDRLAEDI